MLPGGVPCFSSGAPADVLSGAGLICEAEQDIDQGVVQTVWMRG
jgi:hypothetical protein